MSSSSSSSSSCSTKSKSSLPKTYTGKIKHVDRHGSGTIHSFYHDTDLPFSDPTRTHTLSVGDRVEFSLAATHVTPTGPRCYHCFTTGHYASDCPSMRRSSRGGRCYSCGSLGHFARDCPSSNGKIAGSLRDDDDDDEEEEECRIMSDVVCVKRPEDVKKVEEVEDCFILEFDPTETESINFGKLSLSEKQKDVSEDGEVQILGEKGQVACRDYPHPRHTCATHPFKTTSHELHCKMCYCYICDIKAPCKDWTKSIWFQHCDATADLLHWRDLRDQKKMEKQVN